MARPKEIADPQTADPLAEPTMNRRIWSAYLKRDMTRAKFAREVGVSYSTAFNWDQGEVTPDLKTFLRICTVVGYTPNEIAYGHNVVPGEHNAATDEDIQAANHATGAPYEAATMLYDFRQGAGRLMLMTPTWVRAYFERFKVVFDRTKDNKAQAFEQALIHAESAEALARATALKVHPVTPPRPVKKLAKAKRRDR